ANPVSDPGSGVELALLEELDDAGELVTGGVAGAEEGHFAAVEVRIVERDVALEEADEDQPAAMSDILEGALHRPAAAGGIEDGRGQVAAGDRAHGVQSVPLGLNAVRHVHLLPAELEAVLRHIHDD